MSVRALPVIIWNMFVDRIAGRGARQGWAGGGGVEPEL